MTPQEKAKDLYNKFYNFESHPHSVQARRDLARRNAELCVDEIMALPLVWFDPSCSFENEGADTLEYWQSVKQAIQKL